MMEKTPVMNRYRIKGTIEMMNSFPGEIEIHSPQSQTVYFREGDNSFFVNKLLPAYTGHVSKYIWSRRSLPLTSDFIQTKRSLTFPSFTALQHEGIYTLTLTSMASQNIIKIQFTVVIIATPKISMDFQLPLVLYRLPNQKVSLKLRVEGYHLTGQFHINNFPINLSNKNLYDLSMNKVKREYHYLSKFQFANSIDINNNFIDLNVHISNLKKILEHRGQHISLGFHIENSVGHVRIRTIIDIVEYPVWSSTVDQVDCLDACPGDRNYLFLCSLFHDEYTSRNFQINYLWKVNGELINSDNTNFSRINDAEVANDSLILKTDNFTSTKSYQVNCRLNILAPQIFGNKKTRFEEIYDSAKDRNIMNRLEKNITIIPKAKIERPNTKAAIGFIGVFLTSFATIISILVCILSFKTYGKSTNIEKLEIELGNNPEEEYFNNLEFEHLETKTNSLPYVKPKFLGRHKTESENSKDDSLEHRFPNFLLSPPTL